MVGELTIGLFAFRCRDARQMTGRLLIYHCMHIYLQLNPDGATPVAIALAGTMQATSAHGGWTWYSPAQGPPGSTQCKVKPQSARRGMQVLAVSRLPAILGTFALRAWHHIGPESVL